MKRLVQFAPGLQILRRYDRDWLSADLVAGVSVAAVAVPIAIAYSQLAGVPPAHGLYASILPLLAYAIFGSSRQLIMAPDAAPCAIVAATVLPSALLRGLKRDPARLSAGRERQLFQLLAGRAPAAVQLRRSLYSLEPVLLAGQQHRPGGRALLGAPWRGPDRRRAQAVAARWSIIRDVLHWVE